MAENIWRAGLSIREGWEEEEEEVEDVKEVEEEEEEEEEGGGGGLRTSLAALHPLQLRILVT